MCLDVFIDIVIEFHHHFLIVMFLPCTPTYTFFFTLYNDSLPNMLYPLCSFFSIPVDSFQRSYNLSLLFTSIYHPTFYVIIVCTEHSGAQVFIIKKTPLTKELKKPIKIEKIWFVNFLMKDLIL
jgi:hypothetical protein